MFCFAGCLWSIQCQRRSSSNVVGSPKRAEQMQTINFISKIPFFGRRQKFPCLIYLSYSRAYTLHNPNYHEFWHSSCCIRFSCVVSSLPLLGHRDSASAAIFFSTLIYSIYGPYSSNINLQRNTLLVFKFLHVRFLLSVYIFNILPNNIVHNSFKVSDILSNSFSVTV